MAGQPQKIAVEQLLFEQYTIIFKWYWKFKNVCEVGKQRWCEFVRESPTQLATACICDKSEADCAVHDVGGLTQQIGPASSATVLEQFI
jgi:hypothetical protein